jgi:hypothetical protein
MSCPEVMVPIVKWALAGMYWCGHIGLSCMPYAACTGARTGFAYGQVAGVCWVPTHPSFSCVSVGDPNSGAFKNCKCSPATPPPVTIPEVSI